MNLRWVVYLGLLAGAAGLVLFGNEAAPPEVVEAARTARQASAVATSLAARRKPRDATVHWVALRPRESLWASRQAQAPIRNLFAPHSPPPPAAVALAAPPPPQAPALPFTYLGKRFDGTQWDVFLGRGDVTHIAQEGTIIDHTYRVVAIKPPTLTLVYVPLTQTQTLTIGGGD